MAWESKAKKIVDTFLVILLLFMPLALGGVHNWAIITFAISSVIIFNLYIFSSLVTLKGLMRPAVVRCGFFFFLVCLFQLTPLPSNILKFLSPQTFALYQNYSLSYIENSFRTLSIYPWATIWELIKFISYGLIFIVVLGRCRNTGTVPKGDCPRLVTSEVEGEGFVPDSYKLQATSHVVNYLQFGCLTAILTILIHSFVDFNLHIPANAFYFIVILALCVSSGRPKNTVMNVVFIRRIVNSIIIIGFVVAVFAIIYKFSGAYGKIYWVIKKDGGTFGPYVNYDHYAGYMGMCASLAIALFIGNIRMSSFFHLRRARDKIIWLSSSEANSTLLYLFFSVIMTASLFLSSSRGGILSFSIAVILLFILAIARIKKNRRKRIFLAVILTLLIASVIVVWFGPQVWMSRFSKLNKLVRVVIKEGPLSQDIRFSMWRDTSRIIRDFPFFGTGLGTFPQIYPKYRTLDLQYGFLRYAHCDYLQLIAEIGILGRLAVLFLWGLFLINYISTIRRLE